MNKNLPKVFANPINKKINNNKDIFISNESDRTVIKEDNILKKINEIFASPHHVYKSKVKIRTNFDDFETNIVGKTSNCLLTLDGKKININDIITINRL